MVPTKEERPPSLETVVAYAETADWSYAYYPSEGQVLVSMPEEEGGFDLCFEWDKEIHLLRFACTVYTPALQRRAALYELLAKINARMTLGFFHLDDNYIEFRAAIPLRGTAGVTPEQLDDLIGIATTEWSHFFPALQYVWSGMTPEKAIQEAMVDIAGNA